MRDHDSLVRDLEARVAELGFEFVELERAGSRTRPILRLRIDLPAASPGVSISVGACAKVSRELERFLDADERVGERYVLEVSSPGVERPLVRSSDFTRFAGQPIALLGRVSLADRGRRIEGRLVGLEGTAPDERISIRLDNGEVVEVARSDVERAHLVFRWP